MSTLTWPAPAKINLFLHIVGRRTDGYHELQTAFQFLDITDELSFTLRSDGQIHLQSSGLAVCVENNLIVRAALKLQKHTSTSDGANITLKKHIPIGGGLGGGSSDAATTLIALNQLWQLNLSQADLLALGLQLGADVPVFIAGKAAWAEGIGEKLTPFTPQESWYVVVVPPQPVSTAEIFLDDELTRNTRPITIQGFLDGNESTRNDCEQVVCKRYPLIATALDWLNQQAPAHLTGTGGCVFAAVADATQAQAIVAQVPEPLKAFAAYGLNDSPLSKIRSSI